MRHGIVGWFLLVSCTTATAPAPAPPAASAPAPAPATSPAVCTDSSQCAAGALCCPPVNGKAGAPKTPLGFLQTTDSICATDPVHECSGHEICGAGACRSPWPPDRTPPTPARTYVDECHSSRNCPKDTTCTLFYTQAFSASSVCVYNVKGEPDPAHTAPACATDADCKAALPLWKTLLDDARYAQALRDVRCVDLKNDIERRRGCVLPGNAPFP